MQHLLYRFISMLTAALLVFADSKVSAKQLKSPMGDSTIALISADAPPMPEVRLRLPVPNAGKARIANRLLIGGGLCLIAGVPMLVYGISHLNRKPVDPGNVEASNYRSYMPYAAAGVVLTGAGVGMSVPGLVLKIRYGRRSRQTP